MRKSIKYFCAFCLLSGLPILSYGQQKPVAALFGIDSTKANTDINNNIGKPEAKPFDIPVNNDKDDLNNSHSNNKATKPEPSTSSGPK